MKIDDLIALMEEGSRAKGRVWLDPETCTDLALRLKASKALDEKTERLHQAYVRATDAALERALRYGGRES